MKKNTMTLLGILFFVVTGCQNELENENHRVHSIVFKTLFQRTFPVSVPTDFQIKDATPTI